MNYEDWLKLVEREIRSHCYGAVELEDAPYREYYDRGLTIEEAAKEAMDFAYFGTHPPGIRDF